MTLQQQYNLIKEGRENKANFLKNAKFQFPNLFNAYTSYEDSVNVLKSKGLITEGVGGIATGGREQDWVQIFKQNISEEVKAEEKKTSKEVEDVLAHNFDYKDLKNIDNLNGQAFLHGFYTEMQDPKNEEKTTNEVKAIVAKNLAKDPLYYTKDGMFGLKGVGFTTEAPGLGTPKEPKGKYKSSGYGDLRESREKRKLSLKQVHKKDAKGLALYKNTENQNDLYYYDGKVLYSVVDGDRKGPSVRMSLYDITGLEEGLETRNYNEWKKELYNIIKKDNPGYTDGDIAVNGEELTKYFKDGKSAKEVYYDIWLQDAGNYANIGEGWEENQPLKKGEKQTFEPIPPSKSQAHTAGDKLRASTDRYTKKLREIIRELIVKEINEGTADDEVAKAEKEVADAKKKAADAKMKAAQAAQAEANAEEKS